ncbi:hypothetical protein C8J57DRAFT_1234761 [Mycena rebaudengoi]|nr:hypothetical protein C8J57DRAFT_1234761 [Mycena rebaudengoi]
MPWVVYRAYCTLSGCVFDNREGFVAKRRRHDFDPSNNALTANRILTDHLDWSNHNIDSPLISVSTTWDKPHWLAESMRKHWERKHHKVETFIAEISYDVQPSSAYHMMSTAKRLGVEVPPWCIDYGEYVLVGSIPLEHIVKIQQIGTGEGTTVWENPAASPSSDAFELLIEAMIEAMLEMSLSSRRLRDAMDVFTSSSISIAEDGEGDTSSESDSDEVYCRSGSDFCAQDLDSDFEVFSDSEESSERRRKAIERLWEED